MIPETIVLVRGRLREERGKSTAGKDTRSFRKDLSVRSVFQGATKTSGRTSPESRGPPAKTDTGDPNPPMPFSWIGDHLRDIQIDSSGRHSSRFPPDPEPAKPGNPEPFSRNGFLSGFVLTVFRVCGGRIRREPQRSSVRVEAVLRRRRHTGPPRVRPKTRGSGTALRPP